MKLHNPKTLVTWGRHSAHGSAWLKLRQGFSRKYNATRLREGWELAFMPKGEAP